MLKKDGDSGHGKPGEKINDMQKWKRKHGLKANCNCLNFSDLFII